MPLIVRSIDGVATDVAGRERSDLEDVERALEQCPFDFVWRTEVGVDRRAELTDPGDVSVVEHACRLAFRRQKCVTRTAVEHHQLVADRDR